MLQDGLGSVRSVVDSSLNPLESRLYEPYGTPFGTSGTMQTSYGFTGEMTDANGQVYLRARYYNPSIGVVTALDPIEGQTCTPMSLNGYSYVAGNVVNAVDPSGMIYELPSMWDSCASGNDFPKVGKGRGIIGKQPIMPTPTPTPCTPLDARAATVLARTAVTEAGSLTSNNIAVAGLMLSQINYHKTFNTWYVLGTWVKNGWTLDTLPTVSNSRLNNIACYMINGYMENNDPLALFDDSPYPSVASSPVLEGIAGDTAAAYEISIDASRATQFSSDSAYPVEYVVGIGTTRAVIVGGVDITNAWLRYQCKEHEYEVMRESPANLARPFTAPDETGAKFTCQACTLSHYWWNDAGTWKMITTQELAANRRTGYGAKCG